MTRSPSNERDPKGLPAGPFGAWLDGTREVLAREGEADVPCGGCNACCRSAQFVHIRPEERRTLARIPRALLFPAPGLPRGHVLLGYDEHGRCPMLVDDACSIYEDRPITCRTYDCRVFAATGVRAGDEGNAVESQARQWQFGLPSAEDDLQHRAVRAAAAFLAEHSELFPRGFLPRNPSQLAVLAIKVFDVFLDDAVLDCGETVVRRIVAAHERFEAQASKQPGSLVVSSSDE